MPYTLCFFFDNIFFIYINTIDTKTQIFYVCVLCVCVMVRTIRTQLNVYNVYCYLFGVLPFAGLNAYVSFSEH